MNPKKAENNRGAAHAFDKAIQDYSKAIKLNPEDAAAYNNRGLAYADRGEFDAALEDYDKALELKPDYAEVYNNRGNAYFNKGDFDLAIQNYKKR